MFSFTLVDWRDLCKIGLIEVKKQETQWWHLAAIYKFWHWNVKDQSENLPSHRSSVGFMLFHFLTEKPSIKQRYFAFYFHRFSVLYCTSDLHRWFLGIFNKNVLYIVYNKKIVAIIIYSWKFHFLPYIWRTRKWWPPTPSLFKLRMWSLIKQSLQKNQ